MIPASADFSADFYNMITFLNTYEHRNHENIACRMGSFQLGRATGHTKVLHETVKRLERDGYEVCTVGLHQQKGYTMNYEQFYRGDMFRGRRPPNIFIFDCFSHPSVNVRKVEETIGDLECRHYGVNTCKPVYFKVQ